ncbi:MAG: CHAT domain-containing protein, partial [Elainellaceae cyanobacterium]
ALVSQGVPAVLAMAEQIPDDVALTLTRLFYRNLKQDYPVDLSLSRARQGLVSAYSSQQLYWALPILYMHSEFDGYLTSGDRALDNPADALIGVPPTLAPSSLGTAEPAPYEPELLSQRVNSAERDDVIDGSTVGVDASDADALDADASMAATGPVHEVNASLNAEESGGDRPSVDGLTQTEGEPDHGAVLNHAADVTESRVTENAETPELADVSATENESEQAAEPTQDIETEIALELDPPSLNHDDSLGGEASHLNHDAAADFFLPEDDLRVFDEGLTLDEEATTSESEQDEDVSTWSLVEELEGTDTHLNAAHSNGYAGGAVDDGVFTGGVDDEFAQADANQNDASQNDAELSPQSNLGSDAQVEPESHAMGQMGDVSSHAELGSPDSTEIDAQANRNIESAVDDRSAGAEAEEELTTQDQNRHLQIVRSPNDLASLDVDDDEVHRSPKRSPRRTLKKVLLLPLAGVAGAAIVMLGYNIFPTIDGADPQTEVSRSSLDLEDLPQASTSEVVRFANTSFSQNDLPSGQAAVEELLNRGSVDEAQSALETVPDDQIEDPLITFLQGRLVWENLNKGKTDAEIQDVSRYWTFAARRAEDNPLYYNALGFAHYRQNRFHDAINAWQLTLKTLEVQGEAVVPTQTTGAEVSYSIDVPSGAVSNPDALTAYAGIALALAQLSASTESQPYDALSRAIQMQQLVLQSDPSGFSPESLEQSWLWTDSTIQEWQILTQIRPQ